MPGEEQRLLPEAARPKRVKCTATRRDGEPCGQWAILGANVCRMHGGGAPQVRRKAEERLKAAREKLLGLVDPAVDRLGMLLDHGETDQVRLAAAKAILEKAGFDVVPRGAGDSPQVNVIVVAGEKEAYVDQLRRLRQDEGVIDVESWEDERT